MKIGKQTFKLESMPYISYTSSIVGPKEVQGPLSSFFDTHINDVWDKEKTFEKLVKYLYFQFLSLFKRFLYFFYY